VRAEALATGEGGSLSLVLPDRVGERAGQLVGAWRLERLLGSGGMGEVWLASRHDALHQGQAAIKLLQAHQRSPAAQARFAAEARLLARLAHPHIARLLDVGIDASGQRHLVLEYVAGEPIDRWCAGRDSPLAERLRLFLQVCDAVSHAHAQLVVHRDLKPSNILVDGDGQAKLLDFGVAKLLDDTEADLTRTGLAALTPAYAAPEQLTGEPVSVATDVYALGVVLFELLAGQRPHAGDAASPASWRYRAETEPRRLRSLAPTLHSDLDAITAKALQPAPPDRYPSVVALADDLRRHLAHEPVRAAVQTLAYRLRKLVRRRRGLVTAGLLAGAGLIVGGGVAVWQAVLAREAAAIARAEADKAEGARDFLLGLFGAYDAGSSQSQQFREMSVLQVLEAAGRRLLESRDQPPAVRLDLLRHLGRLHVLMGLEDAGARMEQEAWALTREVHDRRSETYVLAALAYGTNLAAAGQTEEGLARIQEAIDISLEPGLLSADWAALSYKLFGLVCELAGDARAPVYLNQAIERFAAWGPHDERVSAHAGMLRWHLRGEDFDAFDREAIRTAALVEESEGRFVFDRYAYEVELASRWLVAGDLARALAALERALPAVESGMGRDHPRTVRVRRQLALLDLRLGDRAAARRRLAELAALPLHFRADEATWRELADAHWIEGDLEAAQRQIGLALQAPVLHPAERAERQRAAADIELLAGRPQAALDALQPAIDRFEQRPGAGSIALHRARLLRAEAWGALGRVDEARRELAGIVDWGQARRSTSSADRLRVRAQVTWSALLLATDPEAALRLGQQAQAGRSATDAVLDDRLLWAAAQVAQAQALKAMGHHRQAHAVAVQAVDVLTRDQLGTSPRLRQARALAGR
jgi:hypothetical protein